MTNMLKQQRSSALVIDPVSSGGLYAPLLAEQGVEVHRVDTERALLGGLREGATPGALDFERDFGGSAERLLSYCADNGIGYVVAGSESCIALCDYLRESLSRCPANSPGGSRARWDKEAMFAALESAGVPSLHTVAVPHGSTWSAGEIATRAPAVVKPSIGAGSVDVRMVRTDAELQDAVATITSGRGFFGDRSSALVQEVYPNPRTEYVVDTFSHDGVHEVLAVSCYDKRVSAEGGFIYERIKWLAPEEEPVSEICDYARAVLDALGVRVGAGHMEIMHNSEVGPRLIDFGARAHGAGHPLKSAALTGTSHIHRECAYAAHVLSGKPFPTGGGTYALPQPGAIIFFNLDSPARCHERPDADELQRLPGVLEATVNATAGTEYPATRSLLDGLALGLAFVSADTRQELDERCSSVRAAFDAVFRGARTGSG